MKANRILPIVLLMILCLSVYLIVPFIEPAVDAASYILSVDKASFLETPEADVIASFKEQRDRYIKVADYLLENEKVFRSRPVVLNKFNNDADKITEPAVKKDVLDLLENYGVKNISSLNDRTYKIVDFVFNGVKGVYTQGIKYQPDPAIIEKDASEYNYVKEYTLLENGWYYYIYYYNEIRNADAYRRTAWEALDSRYRRSVTIDWQKAIVTLLDWDKTGIQPNKDTKLSFVVSVEFNTSVDGLLGPIVTYINPKTGRIVGYAPRF